MGLAGRSNRTRLDPDGRSPASTRMAPWVPASDDPKPSVTSTCGNVAKMRSRVAVAMGAPPFEIENSDGTS